MNVFLGILLLGSFMAETNTIAGKEYDFSPIAKLNTQQEEQNIYTKSKIVPFVISSTGTKNINCGFPPKIVDIHVTHLHEMYFGKTDFITTYSTGFFYNGVDDIDTTSQTGIFECAAGNFSIGRKLFDGFEIIVNSWSGSSTVYFTCHN